MIVRITGEGQYDVPDSELDALNELDAAVEAALDGGDDASFRSTLADLLGRVRSNGTPVADDELVPSDLLLPHAEASIEEVRDLLGDEGLIPG